MNYLIFVFIALTGGVGPRAGYPTITEEIRFQSAEPRVEVIRYDERNVGLNEAVRKTIAPAAKPSFKYRLY